MRPFWVIHWPFHSSKALMYFFSCELSSNHYAMKSLISALQTCGRYVQSRACLFDGEGLYWEEFIADPWSPTWRQRRNVHICGLCRRCKRDSFWNGFTNKVMKHKNLYCEHDISCCVVVVVSHALFIFVVCWFMDWSIIHVSPCFLKTGKVTEENLDMIN